MRLAILNEADQVWTQTIPAKEYYSVQDVCILLDIGGPSVYGAIKRGTLRGVRINGVVHVRHTALMDYVHRRGTAPSFDPTQLTIEDIIPEKEVQVAAEAMAPAEFPVDNDLDFLDE